MTTMMRKHTHFILFGLPGIMISMMFILISTSLNTAKVNAEDSDPLYINTILNTTLTKILNDPIVLRDISWIESERASDNYVYNLYAKDLCVMFSPSLSDRVSTVVIDAYEIYLDSVEAQLYLIEEGTMIKKPRHLEKFAINHAEFRNMVKLFSDTVFYSDDFLYPPCEHCMKIRFDIPLESENTVYQELSIFPCFDSLSTKVRVSMSFRKTDYELLYYESFVGE